MLFIYYTAVSSVDSRPALSMVIVEVLSLHALPIFASKLAFFYVQEHLTGSYAQNMFQVVSSECYKGRLPEHDVTHKYFSLFTPSSPCTSAISISSAECAGDSGN